MGRLNATLLVGTLIVACAGYFGYHNVYLPKRVQLEQYPLEMQREAANQQAQADVATIAQELESFRGQLPPEADASWLVNEALAIADEVGVRVTRVVPQPPRDLGGMTRLAVSLQVTASYHELGIFIDRLERAPVFIHVDRVDLAETRGSQQALSARPIDVVLSTVYVPPAVPEFPAAAAHVASRQMP